MRTSSHHTPPSFGQRLLSCLLAAATILGQPVVVGMRLAHADGSQPSEPGPTPPADRDGAPNSHPPGSDPIDLALCPSPASDPYQNTSLGHLPDVAPPKAGAI